MKLRLYGDSVRFRLNPADVQLLQQSGQVLTCTHLGPHTQLVYGLRIHRSIDEISIDHSDGRILVHLPQQVCDEWTQSDKIEITAEQKLPGDRQLKILIEKEFACLHGSEDDADAVFYPNPNQVNATLSG